MASSSTSSALASASTSTADGNNCHQFDVFLNHRGPDVKNTFVTDLYNRLRGHRLLVFLDREEIRKDRAIRIWDGSGWEGSLGLQNLQNKCLVEVKVETIWDTLTGTVINVECIRMHDNLRDLGRSLADKEHLRRIWRVTGNRSDPSPVQGIKNSAERDRLVTELQGRLHDIKRPILESVFNVEQPPQLIMLRLYNYRYSASEFSTENLRILHMCCLKMPWEHESEAPLELRELYIHAFGLSKIPDSIGQLKHLEMLVLCCYVPGLSLETLPDEFCQLLSLKHLQLRNCLHLRSLPDSFGKLTRLQHFVLQSCEGMELLPDSFGDLTNLQHLEISGCYKLWKLPDSFGNLTKLQHIKLKSCPLKMLPTSFGNLTKLQHIDLSNCPRLLMLPDSFGNLTKLQHIKLSYCRGLEMLPTSFGNLTKLQHIDLSWCENLLMLPNSFGNLIELKFLNLFGCYRLTISSETLGKIITLENFHF